MIKQLLLFLIFSSISFSHASDTDSTDSNVWDVLKDGFTLNHEVHNPAVQKELKWIMRHPDYLDKLEQSKPYIYHIVNELQKRNMPGELALIPMIESEYDPFSSSNKGAAGIWQIIPATGAELGLRQDWWVDGRKSIGPSTNAALTYLNYLHRFFHGNWILAVAAYDSGEGTVLRAVKRSHQKKFWPLRLPQETKKYIPRLLALSEIIQNPERYHVTLPEIPHKPYFKEVNIEKHIDLNHVAELAEMPKHDLLLLNPGFHKWSTRPYRPYKLLIPKERLSDFNRNLANLPKESSIASKPNLSKQYTVKKGDNLSRIAHRHHLRVHQLKQLNPRLKGNRLKPGQILVTSK